jgi:hypothetical protein
MTRKTQTFGGQVQTRSFKSAILQRKILKEDESTPAAKRDLWRGSLLHAQAVVAADVVNLHIVINNYFFYMFWTLEGLV